MLLDVVLFAGWQAHATPHEPQVVLAFFVIERVKDFPEPFDNLVLLTAVLVLSHLFQPVDVDLLVSNNLEF